MPSAAGLSRGCIEAHNSQDLDGLIALVAADGITLQRAFDGDREARTRSVNEAGVSPVGVAAAFPGLSLVVESVGSENDIAGVVQALPPAGLIRSCFDARADQSVILALTASVTQVAALAVSSGSRGLGIGTELVRGRAQSCLAARHAVVYGQFKSGSGLEHFYRRAGFDVLDADAEIPLPAIELDIVPAPDAHERLFVMWGSHWGDWARRHGFSAIH